MIKSDDDSEIFTEILKLDDEIQLVIEEYLPKVIELNKKIAIPKTSNTLLSFIINTNFIKESIYELYKSENLYSINILFRSLIEHFLKFQYIFMKYVLEKNDNIGEEFLAFCSYSEDIDTGKAWKEVSQILGNNPELDPYEILKTINNDIGKYTKKDIINKSNQFKYKNIIRFIYDQLNKNNELNQENFFLKIIPIYSELSSYVHGGPNAGKQIKDYSKNNTIDIEMLNALKLSFHISATVKLLSFLIYHQYDYIFGAAYHKIDRIIKSQSK